MKQRLISAFFGIILLVLVLLCNKYVFDVAVVIISAMAIYEVLSAVKTNNKALLAAACLMPAAIMAVSYFDRQYMFGTVFIFIAIHMLIMLFNHMKCTFSDVCKVIAVSSIISLSFIHISFVRRMDYGVICVFITFIGSWITDTCAYFFGIALGKHKLAPSISPKKTVEGSIGGMIGVTVILTAYTVICANIINKTVNIPTIVITGILCGILSQFGDLCASIIKRENNIKDFGNIMPGHGGVMDRFDSFLFVAPTVYYILEFFPVFM